MLSDSNKPLSYGRLSGSRKVEVAYNRSNDSACSQAGMRADRRGSGRSSSSPVWLRYCSPRTSGTLGTGVAGESTALTPGKWTPPTGPAPRLPNGKPDFSGVWDHPYVPDMSGSNARNPALQKGAGPLPYTPAGLENIKSYDPEKNGDYTGMCMPFGLMRSVNAPYPFQIMQNDKYRHVPLRAEQLVLYRPVQERALEGAESDLVRRVDREVGRRHAHHRHHRLQRIHAARHQGQPAQRQDAPGADAAAHRCRTHRLQGDRGGSGLLLRAVDERAHLHDGQHTADGISCEENNRSLWEGRIKIWQVPGVWEIAGQRKGKGRSNVEVGPVTTVQIRADLCPPDL